MISSPHSPHLSAQAHLKQPGRSNKARNKPTERHTPQPKSSPALIRKKLECFLEPSAFHCFGELQTQTACAPAVPKIIDAAEIRPHLQRANLTAIRLPNRGLLADMTLQAATRVKNRRPNGTLENGKTKAKHLQPPGISLTHTPLVSEDTEPLESMGHPLGLIQSRCAPGIRRGLPPPLR